MVTKVAKTLRERNSHEKLSSRTVNPLDVGK